MTLIAGYRDIIALLGIPWVNADAAIKLEGSDPVYICVHMRCPSSTRTVQTGYDIYVEILCTTLRTSCTIQFVDQLSVGSLSDFSSHVRGRGKPRGDRTVGEMIVGNLIGPNGSSLGTYLVLRRTKGEKKIPQGLLAPFDLLIIPNNSTESPTALRIWHALTVFFLLRSAQV